ncbi:hypothetical protein E2C01_080163 [Portunus trituberculatus]|uniref:Uncharacterized protein n=1 Tax=Portunus trituberculatus TaxID=210409 RepID=A0A5B7IIU9_PORTR|nr:hypothetical protein [Portunus trituberculatus]
MRKLADVSHTSLTPSSLRVADVSRTSLTLYGSISSPSSSSKSSNTLSRSTANFSMLAHHTAPATTYIPPHY